MAQLGTSSRTKRLTNSSSHSQVRVGGYHRGLNALTRLTATTTSTGTTVGFSGGSSIRGSAVVSGARNNVPRNVPKPLQTSSLKKENGGQDVTAVLVNRRNGSGKKVGWGSALTSGPALPLNSEALPRPALASTSNEPTPAEIAESEKKKQMETQINIKNPESSVQNIATEPTARNRNIPWALHPPSSNPASCSLPSGSYNHSPYPIESSSRSRDKIQNENTYIPHQDYSGYRFKNHRRDFHDRNLSQSYRLSGSHRDNPHDQHHRANFRNEEIRPFARPPMDPSRSYPHYDDSDRDFFRDRGHRTRNEYREYRDHCVGSNYREKTDYISNRYFDSREGPREGRGFGYDRDEPRRWANRNDNGYFPNTNHLYGREYHRRSMSSFKHEMDYTNGKGTGEKSKFTHDGGYSPTNSLESNQGDSSCTTNSQHQPPAKSEADIIMQTIREREAVEARARAKKEMQTTGDNDDNKCIQSEDENTITKSSGRRSFELEKNERIILHRSSHQVSGEASGDDVKLDQCRAHVDESVQNNKNRRETCSETSQANESCDNKLFDFNKIEKKNYPTRIISSLNERKREEVVLLDGNKISNNTCEHNDIEEEEEVLGSLPEQNPENLSVMPVVSELHSTVKNDILVENHTENQTSSDAKTDFDETQKENIRRDEAMKQQLNVLRQVTAVRENSKSSKESISRKVDKSSKRESNDTPEQNENKVDQTNTGKQRKEKAVVDAEAKARAEYSRTRRPRTKGVLFRRLPDGTLINADFDEEEIARREDKKRAKIRKIQARMEKRELKRNANIERRKKLKEKNMKSKESSLLSTTNDKPVEKVNPSSKVKSFTPAPPPSVSAWKAGPPPGFKTCTISSNKVYTDEKEASSKSDLDQSLFPLKLKTSVSNGLGEKCSGNSASTFPGNSSSWTSQPLDQTNPSKKKEQHFTPSNPLTINVTQEMDNWNNATANNRTLGIHNFNLAQNEMQSGSSTWKVPQSCESTNTSGTINIWAEKNTSPSTMYLNENNDEETVRSQRILFEESLKHVVETKESESAEEIKDIKKSRKGLGRRSYKARNDTSKKSQHKNSKVVSTKRGKRVAPTTKHKPIKASMKPNSVVHNIQDLTLEEDSRNKPQRRSKAVGGFRQRRNGAIHKKDRKKDPSVRNSEESESSSKKTSWTTKIKRPLQRQKSPRKSRDRQPNTASTPNLTSF